jgi:signal transduction histidine kinase
MNFSSFREKEVAIVVIASIFIVSIVTLFYSTFDVQKDARVSLFEQQKDQQLREIESIANNIRSDSELALSHLRGLANSLYLQNGDLSGNETENLLKDTYAEVSGIGDRLFVIDNKNIVRLNIVPEGEERFIGTDMSSIGWVIEGRSNLAPTFSKEEVGLDGRHRIFITYPIINRQDGNYMGLIGLAIPTVQFFEKYGSLHNVESQFLVAYDKEGNYIATPRTELLGKNFFSEEVQKFFNYNADQNKLYGQVFGERKPSYAVYDFGGGERLNTGYPITIKGEPTYFIFVVTPTETIYSQIEGILNRQQTDLFIQRSVSIAAIVVVTFFVIRLNSKLKQKVKERTKSLEESNEKLIKANEQLEAHDKTQREFINIAAHELRTPVQAILGYSEISMDNPQDSRKCIEPILRNAYRLQTLSENILDITRIEGKNLKLDKEQFDLGNVIINAVKDHKSHIASDRIRLHYEIPKDTIIIEGDKGRITQVISNLLSNAIKFTKEGQVSVSSDTVGKEVIVRVKDSGAGIDPEIMPKLFTKFATKSDKGTGLGLYISKSIVEAHGGRIWAENNNDGKGATFIFTLPIHEPYQEEVSSS